MGMRRDRRSSYYQITFIVLSLLGMGGGLNGNEEVYTRKEIEKENVFLRFVVELSVMSFSHITRVDEYLRDQLQKLIAKAEEERERERFTGSEIFSKSLVFCLLSCAH